VLAVGAGLTPQHGRTRNRDGLALQVNAFAVAFHLELLQIGRQPPQGAVVGRDAAAGEAEEVAVPDIEQPQPHGQVLLQRRADEVAVHLVGAGQQLPEALGANGDGDRQADGRPQRIAAANPVPETEGGLDAELLRLGDVGGERSEMARYLLATAGLEPGPSRAGIGHRLHRGEGLGGNQKQRALGANLPQHRRQLVAVDIRDEVKALARQHEVLQRRHGHLRAEVGTANADVHDIGDRGVGANLLRIIQHRIQRGVHRRGIGIGGGAARRAQQPVLHGPLLGAVDGLASEHGSAMALELALARELQQQCLPLAVDQVLRQVGKDVRRLLAESVEAGRVGLESGLQNEARVGLPPQRLPHRRLVTSQPRLHRQPAFISCSSFTASAAKVRMPSASFSVAIASSFNA